MYAAFYCNILQDQKLLKKKIKIKKKERNREAQRQQDIDGQTDREAGALGLISSRGDMSS